jgi:hypothetical protein
MKSAVKSISLLAVLAGLTLPATALSDQAKADCEMRERGEMKKNQSGPCEFSQRQGYIDITLNNGRTYSLSPQGQPNKFTDQDGKHVTRTEAGGDMHKYKWEHKNLTVRFNGSSASAGHGDHSGSSGPAEWDRGCEDAKIGSYDRSRHSDAYEEGWQACKDQQQQSSDDFEQREWDRGCADAQIGSYDRSRHSDAYEEGWQECNR